MGNSVGKDYISRIMYIVQIINVHANKESVEVKNTSLLDKDTDLCKMPPCA